MKVYKTQDTKTGQFYAIKAFSKSYIQQKSNGVDSLMDEIRKCRSLFNRNIVKFEEYYETENSVYLVFEYLSGDPIISEPSKMPKSLGDVRTIMASLLQGIQYLKEQNIVHKDLKPYNIIYKDNRDPASLRIIDFGLSACLDDQRSLNKVCGTPGFMAPELFRNDFLVEKNSKMDIFSLGVIFYCFLFGRFLFDGKTASDIYHQNGRAEYEIKSFEEAKEEIQDNLADAEAYDLLGKMLSKDPANRITVEEALGHCFFVGEEEESEVDLEIPEDPVSLAPSYLGEMNSRSPVLISQMAKKFELNQKKEKIQRKMKKMGLLTRTERKMTGETREE